MERLLTQALQLTLWGMGMTFASIGILVLGMYAMTYLTREKKGEEGEAMVAALEEEDVEVERERKRRAVAAAVAVALAQREQCPKEPVLPVVAYASGDGPWNAYARGLHVLHRLHYEARRYRR